MDNSVLTPQPFLLDDERIRVYASFRDELGVGRIGYMDLDAKNPKNILSISKNPVLEIGRNGAFDDNGVILGDVLRVDSKIYMYYVAFQLVNKVKFLAFSGLAISDDEGESFQRVQEYPVLDRSKEGLFGRCIHSVIYENGIFKVWYSVIHDFEMINSVPYPAYYIKYTESKNALYAIVIQSYLENGQLENAKELAESNPDDETYEPIYNYLIDHELYDEAEKYIAADDYWHADYLNYMKDCVSKMLEHGQKSQARKFVARKVTYFAGEGSDSSFNVEKVKKELNSIIDSY